MKNPMAILLNIVTLITVIWWPGCWLLRSSASNQIQFLEHFGLTKSWDGLDSRRTFDKFGCLLRKLKEHVVQQGTGAWGSEIDVGPLVLFEAIGITNRRFLPKGLGRAMAKAPIQKS